MHHVIQDGGGICAICHYSYYSTWVQEKVQTHMQHGYGYKYSYMPQIPIYTVKAISRAVRGPKNK